MSKSKKKTPLLELQNKWGVSGGEPQKDKYISKLRVAENWELNSK